MRSVLMEQCANCRSNIASNVDVCPNCGANIADTPLGAVTDDLVVVLQANSAAEAQVAEATLRAEGIEAFVQPVASVSPNIGVTGEDVPELEVIVASNLAAKAREILNAPAISEEELTEVEEKTW
jgi:hypothetical protein